MNDGNGRYLIWAGIVAVSVLAITAVIHTGGIPYVSAATCENPAIRSLWCHAYAWQALIAGSFALGAAGIAWIATKKQIRHSKQTFQIAQIAELKTRLTDVLILIKTTETKLAGVTTARDATRPEACPDGGAEAEAQAVRQADANPLPEFCLSHPNLSLRVQMLLAQSNESAVRLKRYGEIVDQTLAETLLSPHRRPEVKESIEKRFVDLQRLLTALNEEAALIRTEIAALEKI